MNGLEILILIVSIIVASIAVGLFMNNSQSSLKEKEEDASFIIPEYTLEELKNIKAVEQAYNKSIVVEESTIQEEEIVETPKPAKKKRKYYPKKKK
jgi:hypothetical protein